ncbi:MAG: tannase/feruloyl esterase family alpha/beta hydrolase [Deltaproteobacteria bacterium]|nr:tannase/feruloyl esterase family alpha/beta hydrolase [Deltaproteobacteria bacterium]
MPNMSCKELVSDFNRYGVTIISAEMVAASKTVPGHCDIRGMMLPDISFTVKMPSKWNRRFYMVDDTGPRGSVNHRGMASVLEKGYATAASDGGIKSYRSLACNNRQKKIDFGFRAVHETAVTAKEIIEAYYGKPPAFSYFVGASSGGRQALMEAQRYPKDFDGIVCGAPVLHLTGIQMWGIWKAMALSGDGFIPREKLPLLAKAVYEKCDGIDGLEDGLIDDPRKCDFDPEKDLPKCPGDVDGPDCFTSAQLEALKKIYSDLRNSKGELLFPGQSVGAEIEGQQPMWMGVGEESSGWYGWIVPSTSPSRYLGFAQDFLKYMAFEEDNPDFDWKSFDFDIDPPKMKYIASILNATDPDLSAFKAAGGKMIHYHHWADTGVPPLLSINYYEEVLELMGKETMDFYRLYMVPGAFHGSPGVGCGNVDWFTPLVNWVEKGIAPEEIIGSRIVKSKVVRTRPLCPYPKVAGYEGKGSIDDASNFNCVEPD